MSLLDEIMGKGDTGKDPRFPHAPAGWTRARALEPAKRNGLELGDEPWEAVRALREYFARHEPTAINLRELHDALDEKFHSQGGIRRLYLLFPGGPVAPGCRVV